MKNQLKKRSQCLITLEISRTRLLCTLKNATKAKTSQVYITGPIRNNRTSKTHWVVVFGDSGLAWVLKGPFLTGYIEYLLSQVAIKNFNVDHCQTYYNINTWQEEYGDINLWKCMMSYTGNPNQAIKGISFVYLCDTAKGE